MKNHYKSLQIITITLISIFCYSCKKEINNFKPNNNLDKSIKFESGRLKINSLKSFNSLIKDAYNHKVNSKFLQEKFSKEFSDKFVSFQMKKENQYKKSPIKLNSTENNQESPSLEQLVPDPIFASVINENGEIQVDSTIYKVTKYGTFMIPSNKLDELNALISLWNSKTTSSQNHVQNKKVFSVSSALEFSPYSEATLVDDGLYSVQPDIYLYDTYGYTTGNDPVFYEADNIESGFDSQDFLPNFSTDPVDYTSVWSDPNLISGSPNSTSVLGSNEDYIYNSLESYSFGAKTLAGKLLESIRGRDEIHTVKFSDNNRVRVNFYDASYIIYSALGVSVKMQKKNWIGWSGTNADELRIGWDVIQYDASWGLNFTPPQNGWSDPNLKPSHYSVDIPGSNHKFELFDLSILGYQIKPIISINTNKLEQQAIKEAYDLAKRYLSYPEQQNLANRPFAFLTYPEVFSDKRIITVGRDEERTTYNDKMTKTFDWRTGTIKLTFNSSGAFSPSGEIAKDFELSKASIYGIAKYANQWKGVRIIKN